VSSLASPQPVINLSPDRINILQKMSACGHLSLLMGCMFAQKTTELIRRIRRYRSIGFNVLVINYIADNRYDSQGSSQKIVTHDKESFDAIKISSLAEIDNTIRNTPYQVIVIDEGQFFPDLFKYVTAWVDSMNIHLVVGGLSADSERRPFGDMLRLIPHADEFLQLTALCSVCRDGTLAQFSKFLGNQVKQENQVAVGGQNEYIPVCRRHFLSSHDQTETAHSSVFSSPPK